ncbi:MAG: hypothetical protein DLM57_18425 [Pseudonocardiales bacterium]|nr:MAG: hypothetical protein DLM57_18425 [Pseudonocardiales bacterium]
MDSTLEVADWRRQVAELYSRVRTDPEPADAHRVWREGRDRLFREHPQSPLPGDSALRDTGLPYWPYDPGLRFEVPLDTSGAPEVRAIESRNDGTIRLRRLGVVTLAPLDVTLDVWWLAQYAGGLFLPLRDATAGQDSYGGGRYLLDTAKGADLGGELGRIIVDLNFAYHPSCRYNSAWECPLAPEGNRTAVAIRAGERM